MGAHEWAFYGWKEGAGHKYYGPNNATDLWQVKKVNPQSMIHLTEKASGARSSSDAVLFRAWRECSRLVWR